MNPQENDRRAALGLATYGPFFRNRRRRRCRSGRDTALDTALLLTVIALLLNHLLS